MSDRLHFTKEDFAVVGDSIQWNLHVRKREIDKLFEGYLEGHFNRALELGCGSGEHCKHLASYCKKLTALEYNQDRLVMRSDEKTTFVIGDAQDLSKFGDYEMDLIFSSNLIEHLPNIDTCLSECRRVLKPGGVIIRTVPNRTWKIFNFLLYYPMMTKIIFQRLFRSKRRTRTDRAEADKPRLNSNLRLVDTGKPWRK